MLKKNTNINHINIHFNVILIGNSPVGKSYIIMKYLNKMSFLINETTFKHSLNLSNGKEVKFTIYDTSGQERFRSLTHSLLKNIKGVILVYSIDDKNSFEAIKEYWLCNNYFDKDTVIYLIGNKSDLKDERVISFEEGKELAEKYNIKFMEVSAKNNENIQELFQGMAEDIYDKFFSEEKLNENNNNRRLINIRKKNKRKCIIF